MTRAVVERLVERLMQVRMKFNSTPTKESFDELAAIVEQVVWAALDRDEKAGGDGE